MCVSKKGVIMKTASCNRRLATRKSVVSLKLSEPQKYFLMKICFDASFGGLSWIKVRLP